MANNFRTAGSCVAVYNFESITAGGDIVASASSEYSATYAAWKAFDNSAGYWRSSDSSACWLALSWGEGNGKVCTRYDVQAYTADRAPMAWTFQGYDGVNWITLDTQTNQTGWSVGEHRTFDISNTTAYEAYRLNVSANNGGTYVEVSELALRGENDGPLVHPMLSNSHPTGTTADSKGSNTLTVVGNGAIPVIDAVNYRQGAGSLDLELDNRQFAFCSDAKLSTGFPWKAGSSNLSCSTTQWVWVESLSSGSVHRVWMKGRLNWLRGHSLYVLNGASPYFYFQVNCATNEAWAGNVGAGISAGQWYFVATVWDEATRTTRLYVWDAVASSVVYDGGGNFPVGTYGATQVNGSDWIVGSANLFYGSSSRPLDGKIDEHTVWNRALTTTEIELIRDGEYNANWQGRFTLSASLSCTATPPITLAPWYGTPIWPIPERLVFSTDIITSGDGTEQRMALRLGIPLQLFRIPFLLRTQAEAAEWSNMVHVWLKRMWPVPIWPESTLHNGSLAAGISSIAIDTRYADYRANGLALVWESGNAEMVQVASVADDSLTLTRPLVRSHSGPLWIVPLRQGRIINPAARTRHIGGSSIVEMAFVVDDIAEVTGWTAGMTYDDLDVLTEPALLETPEWVERIDPDVIVYENPTGCIGVVSATDFNITTQPHGWAPTTRAACWALRQFLHAKRGPQGPFLVPTFHEDIVLSRPCGAADTSLYVVNRSHSRMGLNDLRTYLAFRPPAADIIPRKVTGISLVSTSEELIAIDTAPGRAFAAGTGLCWVDCCRLERDEIDFEWYGRGKLVCQTDLRRIPNEVGTG